MIFSFITSNAQTGPGGVGNSTNNKLWLRAGDIAQADGTSVTTWVDTSGNNFDFGQTVVAKQPTYKTNILNSLPVVRFNGSHTMTSSTISSTAGDHTVFGVCNSTTDAFLIDNTEGASDANRFIAAIHSSGSFWDKANAWEGTGHPRIATIKLHSWVLDNAGGESFIDGASHTTGTYGTTGKLGATQVLGGRFSQDASRMTGDMAEFIIYQGALNIAQRRIVENYLASKYGLTITNDYYAYQAANKEEVAGIGRVNASNQHLTAQSAGILTIAASAMADNDWLLFGHDNASVASWSTTEAPNSGTNIQRLAREWRVDETNYAGTVTITVDKTLLPALPAQCTEYYLLIDADGDFSSGATTHLLSPAGGNNYQATGVTIPDGSFVTIACIRPVIQLTATSSHDAESIGTVNIQVELNYALSSAASVAFAANVSSTAVGGGTDYSLSASPITITAGNTTNNIVLTINDEGVVELSETVILDLSAPSGAELGTSLQYTFTIDDNDAGRTIGFQAATSNAAESVNPANIVLEISSPSGSDVTVDYVVTGGTATGGGTDYTLASGTATIPGDNVTTTTVIPIAINEDALDENNETIIIAISNPNINASLDVLATQSHTYTIDDNDGPPVVQFTSATSSGQESTSPGAIEVSLSSISGQAITIDYTVAAGTATGGGTDFTLANGTLTIPAGSSSANISPVIINDGTIEGGETFTVTLSNPTGATLGATTVNTYTIADNDNNGYTGPGGVGDFNNNKLWLRAGDIAQADGTAITTWVDTSGNNYDFGQSSAALKPTYKTSILNGKSVARFDGGDALNSTTISSSAGDHTVFGVLNSTTSTYLFDNDEVSPGRFITAVHSLGAYWDGAWKGTAHALSATPNLYSWVLDNAGAESFLNGTSHTTGTFVTDRKLRSLQVLGSRYDQSTQMMTGDIAEWIVYQGALNSAQRIIVENYLASKYGLTISNDYYAHQALHKEEVAGIGRVDASNLHTAAQSAGILKISSPSAMADNEYLLFGHDNASIASWSTTEAPNSGTNIQRLAREWRVDKTGTIGTVSVGISTALLPALPVGYSTYFILVDADGDFSSGATAYPMSLVSGSDYETAAITLTDDYYISIACVKPTIQYTSTTGNQFEPTGPGVVSLTLNYALRTNVTVNYSVTGGTATGSGTDYILANGTATITAGNTTTSINITLIDDVVIETPETILLDISGPSAGLSLGTNTTHTFTIDDDDNTRKINFTASSSNASEATSPVVLTIQSTSASASPITVNYAVTGGTATGSGTDYTLASGTATIPGDNVTTSTTISIPINEDLLDEVNETIIITLSSPSNCNLAATNTTYTYTINDNDAAPTVQFSSSTSNGQESTTPGTIEVSLSGISGQAVTVDYTVAAVTATGGGVDYTLANGTLTIPAASAVANISPIVLDDASIEGGETFTVTLSNPTGATLGATTVNTYTIADNDNNGYTGPGGVGDLTSNKLWLRAGDIAQADGTAITTWIDTSGNNYDFGQSSAALKPTYKTSILNGKSVVRFDGGDALNSTTISSASGDHTVFGVLNSTTTTYLFDNDEIAPGRFITAISPANGAYWDGAWKGTAHALSATPNLYSWVLDDAGAESFLNGTSHTTGTFVTTRKLRSLQVLGSRYDQSTQMMTGDIAEFIVYQGALNSAQRIIVENYLSSKYALTIANDKFTHDIAHGNEVAGIGRVDASNMHTAAQSAKILTVSSPSALADADYLLFGHDNGSISAWTATEAPSLGLNIQRLPREWRFDKTGTVGTVSIGISTTMLPSLPAGYSTYYMLVDSDGDFSTGATLYPMSLVSGSDYIANAITIADNDYVAIAAVRHAIQFTNTLTNVAEPNGPGAVQLTLNYAYPTNVTVNYTVTGGTATGSGTDYTLANGTATITAGNTTTNINITLVNDVIVESDETILLSISGPSAGVSLGTNTTHTFYILDDDNARKIDFTATSSSGTEATTPVSLTVQINLVDAINPTTVDYTVTGGTATGGGTDYTLANGTVSIPANSLSATFDIAINDDAIAELSETVIITIVNPTNANIGTNQVYTYTITDNDVAPTVQFSSATSTGTEGTSPGSISVSLSAVSGQNVTVAYTVADVTATGSGTDYTLASGTLTILAGNTTATLSPSITDDLATELSETFTVTLSAPSGATLGATTVNTFTINDNDVFGYVGPGGVGNSSTNKLWLKAGTIAQADGTAVTSWGDASGNGFAFTQAVGGKQPTYKTNILNGQPVVRFDGTDILKSTTITSTAGDHTLFGVLNSTSQTYIFDNTSGGRFITALFASGAYWDGTWKGTAHTTGATAKLYTWVLDDAGAESFVNGTSHTTGTFVTTRQMGGTQGLGGRPSDDAQLMTGDMGDWIVYQGALNSAQRIIVENYLGAKYNLAIANDKYAYQATNKEDVAGIGYESPTSYHTAAQSAGILKISNATSLSTAGDYLLFGHDNGAIASWTSTESPGAGIERLAREWRFDETATVGTVSVTVDITTLPAMGAGFNGYAVLIDADGDFSSGATIKMLTLESGNLYRADAVTITDGYYMAIAQVQNVSNATGDFSTGATWLTGIVPSSGQTVTIISPHVVTLTGSQTVGSLTVSNGATLSLGSNTLTIDGVGGALTVSGGGTFNPGTGTVVYGAAGSQCISALTYYGLTVSGSGTKTLCGNVDVNGALTITAGTLDVDNTFNYSINLAGNFVNNATFTPRAGTLTFDGTTAQTYTSPTATTFYNVTVNNTFATDPQITLNNPVFISNTLTLTDGIVLCSSGNVITMNSGSTTTIGSANSYINGPMAYTVAAVGPTNIKFPIGKSTSWRPIELNVTHSSAAAATYTSEMFNTSAYALGYTLPVTVDRISTRRYWHVDRSATANFTSATVRLYYSTTPDDDGVSDYTNLTVVKNVGAGTTWFDVGGTATANGTGSILSGSFNSFSDFTEGDLNGGDNSLPIELLDFTATPGTNRVSVNWNTATEINNDYFIVEKTIDGINFEQVAEVKGAGNSSTLKQYAVVDYYPYFGLSYYRLKQVDFDGKYTYSDVVAVEFDNKGIDDFNVYPNPNTGEYVNVSISAEINKEILVEVYDVTGKKAFSKIVVTSSDGKNVYAIDFNQKLAPGVYFITATSNQSIYNKRLIVK